MIAFMTRACRNKLKLPSFSGVVCTGTHIWDLEILENYKDFYGKFIREQAFLSGEIVIHSGHDSKSHESFHFHAITLEMDNLTNFAVLVPCSFNAVANNFVLRGHFTSSSLTQILNYWTRNFHDL